MPSARDLLQQADALMRSNRSVGVSGAEETVPVLTDIAVPGRTVQSGRLRNDEIPVLTNVVARPEPDSDVTIPAGGAAARQFAPTQMESLLPLSEMPEMPQIGDDDSIIALRRSDSKIDIPDEPEPALEEKPRWLEADLIDSPQSGSIEGARDALSDASAPVEQRSAPLPPADASSVQAAADIPEGNAAQAAETTVERAHQPQPPERTPTPEEVAETVYFQVLQNLDLYTDRALQQHLTEHLSPIVERATRELLDTLNAKLGALMRQFVADAIEKQVGVRPSSETPPRDD